MFYFLSPFFLTSLHSFLLPFILFLLSFTILFLVPFRFFFTSLQTFFTSLRRFLLSFRLFYFPSARFLYFSSAFPPLLCFYFPSVFLNPFLKYSWKNIKILCLVWAGSVSKAETDLGRYCKTQKLFWCELFWKKDSLFFASASPVYIVYLLHSMFWLL